MRNAPYLFNNPLLYKVGEGQFVFLLPQRSPIWQCIALAGSQIKQFLQYLEPNFDNLIPGSGKQISEVQLTSYLPCCCCKRTELGGIFLQVETYIGGQQGRGGPDLLSLSLQGGDYTPMTGFRLFSAAACKVHDDASCQTPESS